MKRLHYYRTLFLLTIILPLFCLLSGVSESVIAAGSSSSSISKPVSAREKRNQANVYFDKAERYQQKGKYKDASKQYKKALKLDPRYAEAHSNLGYCFRKQQKYSKAIKSYKKAIKINPRLAEAHEYIGEAYAETGKFDLADQHLKVLQSLDSKEADELAAFIAKMKDNG